MTSHRFILISCLLTLTYFGVAAQQIQSVRLNKYSQNQGLSSDYVTKLAQDGMGFVWAGTQEGLNVYDGNSFQTFTNQSKPKHNISGSLVLDLDTDRKRSLLWVQTSYGPICAFNTKTRTIEKTIKEDCHGQSYSEVWARCMDLQNDFLWIGGLNTLSLYHIPSNSFLNTDHIEQRLIRNGEYNINKISHDNFGNTWLMVDGQGIMIIDEALKIIKALDLDDLGNNKEQKLFFWDATSKNGDFFLGTSWGLFQFKTGNTPNCIKMISDIFPQFSNTVVTSLAFANDSTLLLSTASDMFSYDLVSNTAKLILDQDRQRLANIYEIYYDSAIDLVWLGTQSGLQTFPYLKGPFNTFSKSISSNLKIKHLYAILPVTEQKVYAGGGNGIYQINTSTEQIDLLDTAKTNFVLFEDKEKNIYSSSSTRLFAIKTDKRIPAQYQEKLPKDLQGNRFNSVVNYNDSLILLSSFLQKGLTIWNTKRNTAVTFHHDSINTQIPDLKTTNFIFKGKGKDIFILTDNSIVRFNPLTKIHKTYVIEDPKNKKKQTIFMDMNESNSSYFIGTYGNGMIETDKQFKVKKIYTTQDGLSNNCIYRIFNIKNEKMLMTSNNGLSILDLKTRKLRTYYEGDGLHSSGFEQFCGYQKDNKIYVGGPGGFTIVNTDLLPDSSIAPVLYPIGIAIDTHEGKIDSTDLFMSSFTIPNHAIKTTIRFVAPDYKNADRMTYQYKINELSSEWINLGNQNFVDLIGVNPGTYHFQAKATSSEGTESVPIDLRLDFLPKWYQTLWFKLLLLCLVGGLVFLIQRYRMIQIKKQQIIRTEIANDLHDDIGSTLNSLKIFAHLAQSDSNNKTHIHHIEESISEATVGLRDMIWVLEDEQDTVYEIMERIKKFASPVCLANQIDLVSNVQATSERSIPKKIKRNIFLIAKECINNSVKYAECSTLHVTFEHNKSNLKLIIEDDGKGFDFNEITKGKGLESIKYRASQVQFDCQVVSKIGKGTKTMVSGVIK